MSDDRRLGSSNALTPAQPGKTVKSLTWARVGVAALLIIVLLSQLDLDEIRARAVTVDPRLIAGSFLCLVLVRYLASLRWYILLRAGADKLRFQTVRDLVLVSGFLGYFLPGAASELVKTVAFWRSGRSVANAVASILVERTLALVALIVLVIAGLAFSPLALPDAVSTAVIISGPLLLAAIGCAMSRRLRTLLDRTIVHRITFVQRLSFKLYGALDQYRGRETLLLASFFLAIIFQFGRVVSVILCAEALRIDVDPSFHFAVVPVIYLINTIPLSVGGIGVREVAFVTLYGVAGVPPEQAFLLAILHFMLSVLAVLPGGWIYARRGIAFASS